MRLPSCCNTLFWTLIQTTNHSNAAFLPAGGRVLLFHCLCLPTCTCQTCAYFSVLHGACLVACSLVYTHLRPGVSYAPCFPHAGSGHADVAVCGSDKLRGCLCAASMLPTLARVTVLLLRRVLRLGGAGARRGHHQHSLQAGSWILHMYRRSAMCNLRNPAAWTCAWPVPVEISLSSGALAGSCVNLSGGMCAGGAGDG